MDHSFIRCTPLDDTYCEATAVTSLLMTEPTVLLTVSYLGRHLVTTFSRLMYKINKMHIDQKGSAFTKFVVSEITSVLVKS